MSEAATSATRFIDRLYAAAEQAGLLQRCRRLVGDSTTASTTAHTGAPTSMRFSPAVWVALTTPDEALLDGLAVASDPSIRFPSQRLAGLKKGEVLEVDGTRYRVRDVRSIGDGSEMRAHLSRV